MYILGHLDELPVQTSAVAETLNRSPATVTETFQRLEDVGVVRSGGPRAAVMPSKTDDMEEMDEYEDYSPPF